MKVSDRENNSGEAGGDRGKGARRVGGIHLRNALFISKAQFVIVGGVRDYFVTKSSALVMFRLLRERQSVPESDEVSESDSLRGQLFFLFILLSFN